MPNHMTKIANIVENGTAPDERFPQMKKFKKNPTPKTIAGYNVAVWKMRKDWFSFQQIQFDSDQSRRSFPIWTFDRFVNSTSVKTGDQTEKQFVFQ